MTVPQTKADNPDMSGAASDADAPPATGAPADPSLLLQLRAGIEHHRNGRLAEAEQLYRQVLQADPRQPDALHYLGVVALQVGQFATAEQLIGAALQLGRANHPEVLNNY